jgi:LPS-assembly protein
MHRKTPLYATLLLSLFAEAACPQGLGLKLEEELQSGREAEENAPVFVDAERIRGRQEREIEALGNVRLRRTGETVFADYLRYDLTTQEVVARGNLRFERQGVWGTGVGLRYNLADSIGEVEEVDYFLTDIGVHGEADRLITQGKTKARIEDATYTNCEVGEEDWYIRARRIDLDRTRDLGVARNASIVFKGVPILYTPYLDFSLSRDRKSGFLSPSIGQTAQTGFDFTQPFYFNIAPNYDATFEPRYMARRGVQLGGEFRYLKPNLNGDIRAQYLENDRVRDETRYALNLRHDQRFGANTTGYVRWLGVSDDFYFVDLSNQISATSLTNLPREAGLSYDGGWWNLSGRVQDFQTLQDPLAPIVPPYARLPQINLVATRPTPSGLDVKVEGELVDFDHPTRITARRDILYPSVSLPLRTPYLYVTPKVGYHYTSYSFDGEPPATTKRQLPIFSLDSAITFERQASFLGDNFIQTLEPRLYYVYIPFVDQDDLPVFDTSIATFNLASIFTENQFTGGDRINDADQLTAAISTRFLEPRNGSERLRFTLAQRYYFAPQLVTLNTPPRSSDRSDVLLEAVGTLAGAWNFVSFVQYGAVDDQLQRNNHALQYRPDAGKVANLAYRFTRDQQEQVDVSAQWPLTSKLSGLVRWNHSLRDDKLLESLLGLEYNAGCWTTRLVATRFVVSETDYSESFFIQLELNGVSRLGQNPLDTLRRNIQGYTKGN